MVSRFTRFFSIFVMESDLFETVSFFSGAAHSSFVFLVLSSGRVARVSPFILTHDRAPDPNKQHTHRSLIHSSTHRSAQNRKRRFLFDTLLRRFFDLFIPFIDRLSIDRFIRIISKLAEERERKRGALKARKRGRWLGRFMKRRWKKKKRRRKLFEDLITDCPFLKGVK